MKLFKVNNYYFKVNDILFIRECDNGNYIVVLHYNDINHTDFFDTKNDVIIFNYNFRNKKINFYSLSNKFKNFLNEIAQLYNNSLSKNDSPLCNKLIVYVSKEKDKIDLQKIINYGK